MLIMYIKILKGHAARAFIVYDYYITLTLHQEKGFLVCNKNYAYLEKVIK